MKRAIHFAWTYRILLVLALASFGGWAGARGIQTQPNFLRTNISLEKNSEIDPKEPVVINFSRAVIPVSFNGKVKITPSINAKLAWSGDGKKLTITPDQFWNPESDYVVSLGGGKNIFLTLTYPVMLEFSTVAYPKVSGFSPEAGAKDVILDIEDPVTIDFERSTENFFIRFDINPPAEVTYQNNPEKTQFELLPKVAVKEGQKYEVKISAKYIGDARDNFKEIYSSSFDTLLSKPRMLDNNYAARIEQAKAYTQAKIFDGKYIDINLSAQILSIFEAGKLLDSYMVSTGKRGMETPKGTWAIANKTPRAWSKEYGLFMPYWMAIMPSGKVGIHELPEWPGGYKEGAAHLGIPVSHGCVRLGIGPAKRVYDWADIGTPVIVY
jgi:lipoprotein-anchoring transpeptidase ErfK/SrfK